MVTSNQNPKCSKLCIFIFFISLLSSPSFYPQQERSTFDLVEFRGSLCVVRISHLDLWDCDAPGELQSTEFSNVHRPDLMDGPDVQFAIVARIAVQILFHLF